MRTIKVLCLLMLTACGGQAGIVQVSDDTYRIERSDKGGIFGNAAELRKEVLREADAFAAEKGKVAEDVILNEIPMRMGRFAKVEYTFRLVDPKTETGTPDDVYTKLLKLDDLRERGILTQEEFDQEKAKILAQDE